MNLGAPELLIVLVVILVLFGGAKLPKLARSLGEARREFETANAEAERSSLTGGGATPGTPTATPTAAEREADLARREAELARREAEARNQNP
ncbi:MAG TPA: twin-arginine translocase TatA/TatE family subunit [Iamia sp.]|nr:twin-arginine translocase TatA/TatE family subunit [Iamia sp.]